MFQFKSKETQLIEERHKREALGSELRQTKADLEYVAMMGDIELDTGGSTDE